MSFDPITRADAEARVSSGAERVILRPSSLSHRFPNVYAITYLAGGGRIQHSLVKQRVDRSWIMVDYIDAEDTISDTTYGFESLDKLFGFFLSLSEPATVKAPSPYALTK